MTGPSTRWVFLSIATGVLAWGAFHAVGAYLYNDNLLSGNALLRPIVVMLCVLGFLGFWWLMLTARRARIERDNSRHR